MQWFPPSLEPNASASHTEDHLGMGQNLLFFISIFGENDDPITSIIILAYLGYQGFDPQPSHSRCPVQCKSVGLPWKQRNESYHFVARSGGTFCGRTPPQKKEKGVWSGGSANICVQQSKRQKKMEDWSQKWDQWPSLQKGLLLSAKNIQPFLDGPWDLAVGCCWAVAGLLLMGRISLTVCVLYVFALECCGQTVGNISQVPVVWFCTFLQQFEWRWKASHRHFILAHCLSYIQREMHLRITQCGFDISITATFYVECPFTIFILKLVSALPSPRIGFLVIVRLSFRATAKKQKMHVLTYQRENWLHMTTG